MICFHTKRQTEQRERLNLPLFNVVQGWRRPNLTQVCSSKACSCWEGRGGRVLEHRGGWTGSGRPRAGIWRGAGFLRFEAEKRPLTKTEKETLPLHPLDGAGGFKRHQTEPRMELYRDGATLYKCTPAETADLSFPPHYTQAESQNQLPFTRNWFGFLFLLQFGQRRRPQRTTEFFNQPRLGLVVLCVVKQAKLGSLVLLSTMLSFTWPRSSTPPSTHSRPTERFSAASAFQIRHSNTKNKPRPFTF